MKFIKTLYLLLNRNIKLILFCFLMSPFFILRILIIKKHNVQLSFFDKFILIILGELYIFGKKKIELREIYENQRKLISEGITLKKLIFFIPGQWYTLSPLESALLILMMPKKATLIEKILLLPYIVYVFFFDESKDKVKANHGIACALSLSISLLKLSVFSRHKYYQAIKILKKNSNFFFYDEGSTSYHIFVTSLFKNYFFLKNITPKWFKGYDNICLKLINSSEFFYFGDDDKSKWLYDYRYKSSDYKLLTISELISDFYFKKSILEKYFNIYRKNNRILLVCIRGSAWGHSHYMIGSVLYFINNKNTIKFKKNTKYTLDSNLRNKERFHSCNSPIQKNVQNKLNLAYFKPMPDELISIKSYKEFGYKITIHANGWSRNIDYSDVILKVVDTDNKKKFIMSSLFSVDNQYLIYKNDYL
jgi:hypothetical protein